MNIVVKRKLKKGENRTVVVTTKNIKKKIELLLFKTKTLLTSARVSIGAKPQSRIST